MDHHAQKRQEGESEYLFSRPFDTVNNYWNKWLTMTYLAKTPQSGGVMIDASGFFSVSHDQTPASCSFRKSGSLLAMDFVGHHRFLCEVETCGLWLSLLVKGDWTGRQFGKRLAIIRNYVFSRLLACAAAVGSMLVLQLRKHCRRFVVGFPVFVALLTDFQCQLTIGS